MVVAINATVGKNIGAGAVILAVIGTIALLGAVLLVNLALFGVMFPQTAHRIQHAWIVHHYGRTPARRVTDHLGLRPGILCPIEP